jgi:fatty-acyl-CoA synthase
VTGEHLVVAALRRSAAWADPVLHDHGDGRAYPLTALLADALDRSAGIRGLTGDTGRQPRVGILMQNGVSWLRAALAVMGAGAMVVPLPLPAGFLGAQAYVDHILLISRTARLDAVLIDRAAEAPTFRRVRQQAPDLRFADLDEFPAQPSAPAPGRPAEPCVVQFTSGSTGRPKGVVLTQANVAAALDIIGEHLCLTPTDRLGTWLPLFHDMGLFTTLTALRFGVGVDLWTPSAAVRRPLTWLAEFAAARCTVLASPNFFYENLATLAQAEPETLALDLSRWRIALNGAETVRPEGVNRFTRTFAAHGFHPAAMWPVYGLAEATLPGTMQYPGRPYATRHVVRDGLTVGEPARFAPEAGPDSRTVLSCGRELRATALRIAGLDDRPLPTGHLGEIQLAGPSVTPGYLDLPRSAAPLTDDGWLKTGDLGFLHDGDLFITGRLKNMAVVNGHNVYAEDIEGLVRATLGGTVRCGAVAGPDQDGVERLRVVFETTASDERRADEEALVAAAVARALGAVPVTITGVAPRSIAHTSSGKVQRHRLPVRT